MQFNPYKWYQKALRTPGLKWLVIVLTFVYIFSPIDLIPDFIPGIGIIDDSVLLIVLVSELIRMAQEYSRNKKLEKTNQKQTTSNQ
jgi:uncharacterized membrane protein YkvA (DUF1232 family)